jgi:hypothetical protein
MHLPAIDTERYIAFLLSTLPKLAAKRLYAPQWPLPLRKYAVLDRALREIRHRPGIGLEFGVFRGWSLSHSARKYPRRRFYGFDSFAGLPRDGRPDWKIDFALPELPKVPPNCRLVTGWFSDTIPAVLAENRDPIAFVNIDCDLYSSTRDVLLGLGDRLRPGTVFYFDELINYDSFLWNEMLALFEFLESTGFGVEWLALHCRLRGVEEVFRHYEADDYPHWRKDFADGYRLPAAAVLTAANDDLGLLELGAERRRVKALATKFERFTDKYRSLWTPAPQAVPA